MNIEEILNSIKIAQANKLKKEIILIVIICMPLLITKGDPVTSIQMMILMSIPSLLVIPRIIYHLYIYYNPKKAACFKRLEKLVPRENVCDFIIDQLDKRIVEDGVVIITPELLIDMNNYENIFVRSEIKNVGVIADLTGRIPYYQTKIDYSDKKRYIIDYSDSPNTKKEVNEIARMIMKRGQIIIWKK